MEQNEIYFDRKIYNTMLKWKSERSGDTALLIQGARRIGKSTIAQEFARKEYKSYILIDFSKVSKEVSDLSNEISDLNYLFLRLQFIYQVQLYDNTPSYNSVFSSLYKSTGPRCQYLVLSVESFLYSFERYMRFRHS